MIQAKTYEVRCDWPDCQSISDVTDYSDRPTGWATFPGGLQVRSGLWLGDLCTIHVRVPLGELAGKAAGA